MGHEALVATPRVEALETQDAPFYLYERHALQQFADAVDMASVDIFVGIVFQHLPKRLDAELGAQHLLALGA